jgi:hypothetical protein
VLLHDFPPVCSIFSGFRKFVNAARCLIENVTEKTDCVFVGVCGIIKTWSVYILILSLILRQFKHGVTEADIRHAFEHRLIDHPMAREEYKHLLLGFDSHLNLLEILYNEIDDKTVNVFHAMTCRKAWRDLANL